MGRGCLRGRVRNVSLKVGRTRLGGRGVGDAGFDEVLEGVGETPRFTGASKTLRFTFSFTVSGVAGLSEEFSEFSVSSAKPEDTPISLTLGLPFNFIDGLDELLDATGPAFNRDESTWRGRGRADELSHASSIVITSIASTVFSSFSVTSFVVNNLDEEEKNDAQLRGFIANDTVIGLAGSPKVDDRLISERTVSGLVGAVEVLAPVSLFERNGSDEDDSATFEEASPSLALRESLFGTLPVEIAFPVEYHSYQPYGLSHVE